MRAITFLFSLTLATLVSNAQTDSIMKYFKNIPDISAEYEVLNRDLFPGVITKTQRDSLAIAYRNWELMKKKAKTMDEREKLHYPYDKENLRIIGSEDYRELDTNGVVQKYYWDFETEIVRGKETLNPYIYIHKSFYPNDSLRTKGLQTIYSFFIGKWYHYDEKGNLIKVVDYDESYDFTTEDIINYCIKEGIDLDRKYLSEYSSDTEILKAKDKEGNPIWKIFYRPYGKDSGTIGSIQIDGKTGAIIKRKEEFMIE